MSTRKNRAETGWILIEIVVLGLIVLAAAAALTLFARTAMLEEHAAGRMEAAFVARAQLSMMEAELDQGIPPLSGQTEVSSNDRVYQIETSIVRQDEFYDVHLRISWEHLGHEEQADFVRRMRHHDSAAHSP